MKQFCFVTMVMGMFCIALQAQNKFDVNGDGIVNGADIVGVYNYIVNGDSENDDMTFTVKGVSFTMKKVKGGTFIMGATPEQEGSYNDEKPVHQVTLTEDYYMGETVVTQALWQAVTGKLPTEDGPQWYTSTGMGDNYPAYYINYEDVQSFLAKLNTITGQNFRMPTEAEWEFAARGGSLSKSYQYSGGNAVDDVAWYVGNSNRTTHEVKTKSPNELGLYDMSGNVWEWCSDWYGNYRSPDVINPTGSISGSVRVCRGGSWDSSKRMCRITNRGGHNPSDRGSYRGFRLALGSIK